MDETLKSLVEEGVIVESAFLDKQGEDLYLIYYMKAKDITYAYGILIIPIRQLIIIIKIVEKSTVKVELH